MRRVDLRALKMPVRVHTEVLRLLATIKVAESIQAVRASSNRAEGFVLGLETVQAFNNDLTESLYIGFESAAQNRLAEIRDTEY